MTQAKDFNTGTVSGGSSPAANQTTPYRPTETGPKPAGTHAIAAGAFSVNVWNSNNGTLEVTPDGAGTLYYPPGESFNAPGIVGTTKPAYSYTCTEEVQAQVTDLS